MNSKISDRKAENRDTQKTERKHIENSELTDLNPNILIMTLTVNSLNTPIKRQRL